MTVAPSRLRPVGLGLGLLVAAAVHHPSPAWALDPQAAINQYVHTVWGPEQGLSRKDVVSVAQSPDGYLWLGGRQGLLRFDGVRFTTYDKANTPELRQSYISALFADRDGSLWVGTYGGGLARFRDGKFVAYGKNDGLADDLVRAIHQGPDGAIWVGTNNGLSRFHDGRFTTYTRDDGLVSNHVQAVLVDQSGVVWVGTPAGLSHLQDGRFTSELTIGGRSYNETRPIYTLAEGADGALWLGTHSTGVLRLKDRTLTSYTTAQGLVSNLVYSLYRDPHGTLWVGGLGGMSRFKDGRFETQMLSADSRDGVFALFEDREGSLWAGTCFEGGLHQFRDGSFRAYTVREGLAGKRVWSVAHAQDGSIWIAATGQALSRIKDGRIVNYGDPAWTGDRVLRDILASRDGSVWVGSDADGLLRFKDGRFRTYTRKDGLSDDNVGALAEGPDGALWMGTDGGGLNRFKDGAFTTFTRKDGLSSLSIKALHFGHDGSLWIGTNAGLDRLKDGVITVFDHQAGLSGDMVRAIYEDDEGTLWVGTAGEGLNRLRDGRFVAFRARDGLFDDMLRGIVDDGRGQLWLGSNKGLFRVSKKELDDFAQGKVKAFRSVSYGAAEGLGSGAESGLRAPDGTLWFAMWGAVVNVNPRDLRVNQVVPPVVVEEVLVDGQAVPGERAKGYPPGRGEVEIHYTALTFLAPQSVRFKYHLDGFDAGWVEAGPRRAAYYTNLPPGHYRFRVAGCNSDGIWNEVGASYDFSLEPHLYQRPSFRLFGLLAAVLAVLSIHRAYVARLRARQALRVQQLQAHAQELTLLVEERTRAEEALRESNRRLEEAMETVRRSQERIVQQERLRAVGHMASGIAHDFNNALAPILGFSELLLSRPRKIADPALVERYVRLMNTAAKDAAHVVSRLREVYRPGEEGQACQACDACDLAREAIHLTQPKWKDLPQAAGVTITVETDLDRVLPVRVAPSAVREALMNLIFNAVDAMPRGGRLTIGARRERDHVVLEVRDTGAGMTEEVRRRCLDPFFTTKGERGTGLGLALVEGTLKRHGGDLEIDSHPGQGTCVRLRLPVDSHREAGRAAAGAEPDPGPLRILVVDDEPMVRQVVNDYLEEAGHRVETAAEGAQGLAKLQASEFDLIVADRAMPGMNGAQFAVAAKKLRPTVPVVLLTGFGDLMNASGERPEGVDLVVGKPITIDGLQQAVRTVLGAVPRSAVSPSPRSA